MSNKMAGPKKHLIIFSGYNQRAVIAFLRTLEAHRLPYSIIAHSADDLIFLTKYANNVRAVRENPALELNDMRESIKKVQAQIPASEYVIAPSTEALNRFILANGAAFGTMRCTIPLVSLELYETVSDKLTFTRVCREHGISVPAEYLSLRDVSLPYVAKPKKYYDNQNRSLSPILVLDEAGHKAFKGIYNPDDYYLQEYVSGQSYYLLYYFYKDGNVAKFSQKNFIQQPGGKSIIAAESARYHLSEESLKYERMFKAIGFSGLVMVEVKRYKGMNYMIEANPRFWGPSQLFVDAGVNLFDAFLVDNGFLKAVKPSATTKIKARYFWGGGLLSAPRENATLKYHGTNHATFLQELGTWVRADIYNREDTKELFMREMAI